MKSIIRRILNEQSDNGIIVYHGGKRFDRLRPGLFTTTDKEQVKWYVDRATDHGREEGVLVTLRLHCNNILTLDSKEDFENKWIPIIEDSGIDYEYNDTGRGWIFRSNDINKHGGYIDDNPFDLIYVPNFIKAVIKNGYDCIQGEDYFGMSSMEIYIPLDVSKVEIIDVEEIKPNSLNESRNKWVKLHKFRNYIIDDLISKTTIEKNTGGWDVYMITTPFSSFGQFFGEESIDSEISPNRLFILSYLNKFYGIEKPEDLISIINSYKDRILEIILEKRQSDNT